MSNCVVIDFGELLSAYKEQAHQYLNLSTNGDFLEAINQLYDVLRQAETNEKADFVLIANILEMC